MHGALNLPSNFAVEWLAFLLRVTEILCSNPGSEVDCHGDVSYDCYHAFLKNSELILPHPFQFIIIYNYPVIRIQINNI
jgi:hypothetical protein